MNRLPLVLFSVLISSTISYITKQTDEKYTLIPVDSELCTNTDIASKSYDVYRRISFLTGPFNANRSKVYYVCRALVQPMGLLVRHDYPQGSVAFWMLRYRVRLHLTSCGDYLKVIFIDQDTHKETGINYTCQNTYPLIVATNYRKMRITWNTKDSSLDTGSNASLEVVSYMRFKGNFSSEEQRIYCERQSGFWCGNATQVCLNENMRCDGVDDCFDGGTDEADCRPLRNMSVNWPTEIPSNGGWTAHLPWIALAILPLILLFALARICSQKRHFDLNEDYKMSSSSEDGLSLPMGGGPMSASWCAANGEGVGLRKKGDSMSEPEDGEETETMDEDDRVSNESRDALSRDPCSSVSIPTRPLSGRIVGTSSGVVLVDRGSSSSASSCSSNDCPIRVSIRNSKIEPGPSSDKGSEYDYPDSIADAKNKPNHSSSPTKTDKDSLVVAADISNNPIYDAEVSLKDNNFPPSKSEVSPSSYKDILTSKQSSNLPKLAKIIPNNNNNQTDKDSEQYTPLLIDGKPSSDPLFKLSNRQNSLDSVVSYTQVTPTKSSSKDGVSPRETSPKSSPPAANGEAPNPVKKKEPEYDPDYILV